MMKYAVCWLLVLLMLMLSGCRKSVVPASAEAPAAPASADPVIHTETPAPTPSPTSEPTSEPTPASTPEPTPFSIVWMSDTQSYIGMLQPVLDSMMRWTAEACRTEGVKALVHTGDIVSDPSKIAQWENYRQSASVLPPELVCISACGNHDAGTDGLWPQNYLTYRPDTQLDPARSFLDGQCRYVTFEAGGMKLLMISIAYMREIESLDWAREVLAAHSDYYGILLAHSYLTTNANDENGGYTGGGVILRDGLVKPSPNLRMVLCGHTRGSESRPLPCDDDGDGTADREAQQFLLNYQGDNEKTMGYLRFLRFDVMTDSIEIHTYSPWLGTEGVQDDPLGAVYTVHDAGLAAYTADDAVAP